jgi:hypothetical protein
MVLALEEEIGRKNYIKESYREYDYQKRTFFMDTSGLWDLI